MKEAWVTLLEFERKKRSNLIFYGIRGEARETQSELINKVAIITEISIFQFFIFTFLDAIASLDWEYENESVGQNH